MGIFDKLPSWGPRPLRTVQPLGDGRYALNVPHELLEVLSGQLDDLRGAMMGDSHGDNLRRLFPTAYANDPALEDEYQRLMRSDLLASRLTALDTFEQTLNADELTEGELQQWMQSINALRLAIGTALDIGPESDLDQLDADDPSLPAFVLYHWLSELVWEIVTALRAGGALEDGRR